MATFTDHELASIEQHVTTPTGAVVALFRGFEFHNLGTPRRRRKVRVIRTYRVNPGNSRLECTGFHWRPTTAEINADFAEMATASYL